MIYGLNDNNNNYNPNKLLSIITSIVVIIVGLVCFVFGKKYYDAYSPIAELIPSIGIVGILIIKYIYAFLLLMIFGIIHTVVVIRIMEFIKQNFFE